MQEDDKQPKTVDLLSTESPSLQDKKPDPAPQSPGLPSNQSLSPDSSPGRSRGKTLTNHAPTLFHVDKELEISHEEFNKKKRHVIIMTESGKPVYSRYGDEAEISPVVATLSVIINKLRGIKGDGSSMTIKKLETNSTKTIIHGKYGLYFVYITKNKSDHDFLIQRMAESIFHQVRIGG